jgi:hypothetical protein
MYGDKEEPEEYILSKPNSIHFLSWTKGKKLVSRVNFTVYK